MLMQRRGPYCATRLQVNCAAYMRLPSASLRVAVRARVAAFDGPSAEDLLPMKLELLKKVACLNRGAIASSNDKYEVSSLVEVLEEAAAAAASPPSLDGVQGKWELLYSSVEQFRSSPFFWAFQEGLVQSRELSAQIFAFTDAVPGATIGAAFQTISFDTGRLISEVDMEVFPALRGTVVTTSAVEPEPPRSLVVTVQSTRVANSNVLPFADGLAVPVQALVEAVRGPGSTRVTVDVTYLDDDLRVARTRPDGEIFVYRRV
ncbi:putative plastid-lipid-associated protein 6, chloroplastic [Tetrabaena socialis]|uniref:Putative plastid-lipid-associated protein 6, chloroplastic n=1 Tax=Tetrabaena socialis TaxID=47790 RepID=A0A2J8A0K2_9CHLO|nr:putative plastid-lipid-associated protein 6, chloroplastic [Tetrabaena socialis]|eukprot:PNH06061.1 putative plastid-lipid-associated protein 6, chloroplastic [Tetrabaena socialis]